MARATLVLAALAAFLAGPAASQTRPAPAPRSDDVLREGGSGAVPEERIDRRVSPGAQGNGTVPGTTPGTNIGGTPTSGPPGSGGAAGGPSIGN